WQLGDGLLAYGLATLRVEHHPDVAAKLSPAAGFDSGLLWRNGAGNMLLEAQADYFHNGGVGRRLGLAHELKPHLDLGLRPRVQRADRPGGGAPTIARCRVPIAPGSGLLQSLGAARRSPRGRGSYNR